MVGFNVQFIGIGAARSGTSWLVQCLREHPEVCVPSIKELCFFSKTMKGKKEMYWHYLKGIKWYEGQFLECKNYPVKGEFSIDYMYDSDVPALIKKHFPDVKLIACLRNPIERAYSHYWWNTANFNRNPGKSFREVLRQDKEYVERSMYYKELKRFYDIFPKSNIHIVLFDDIISQPEQVVRNLYGFLGVDDDFAPPSLYKKINPAGKARFKILIKLFGLRAKLEKSNMGFLIDFLKKLRLYDKIQRIYVKINREKLDYASMEEGTQRKLQGIFKQDIEKLEGLIGRDLSAWK